MEAIDRDLRESLVLGGDAVGDPKAADRMSS